MLGVSIENNFSVTQHVQRLVNASAQTVYALRVLHGPARTERRRSAAHLSCHRRRPTDVCRQRVVRAHKSKSFRPQRHWLCVVSRTASMRDNQRNETPAFISPDLLPPNSTDRNPVHYKNIGINTTAGIASSWCRWTKAALNGCLASLWAKCHRWLSWSVAQMSLHMNLCEMKTFWAFNLAPLTHCFAYVVC